MPIDLIARASMVRRTGTEVDPGPIQFKERSI